MCASQFKFSLNESDKQQGLCLIFPDPVYDFAVLNIPDDLGKVSFSLFGLTGKLLYKENYEDNASHRIPVAAFYPGIYVGVIENIATVQTLKLIIE